MAKPTIASLTAEVEVLKTQLEEANGKVVELEKQPDPTAGVNTADFVKKEEFDKLFVEHQNLAQEHDEMILRYQASPDLHTKLKEAVEKLSEKPRALLFKKLSLALAEVKRIPKTGWNDFHRYKYAMEGDILDGIRPILSDVGLMLWTTIEEDERKVLEYFKRGNAEGKKTVTRVKVLFTIGCADTGEILESRYIGEGEDEADKGLYKAYTGATKYFLSKNFLISSGDILNENEPPDPEHHSAPKNNGNGSNQRQNQNKGQSHQKQDKRPEYDNKNANTDRFKNEKEEIKTLFKRLGGGKATDKDFDDFYTKQSGKGVSHARMIQFLNDKLKEQEIAKTDGQPPTGANPEDQTPPPIEDPNNPIDPPQDRNEGNINVNEPVNQPTKKNPDDMTIEEYINYVEDSLPFPLTDSEKEQIRQQAENGKRDHRK